MRWLYFDGMAWLCDNTPRQVVNTFRRYGRTFLMMMLFAGLFVGVMWYFEVSAASHRTFAKWKFKFS